MMVFAGRRSAPIASLNDFYSRGGVLVVDLSVSMASACGKVGVGVPDMARMISRAAPQRNVDTSRSEPTRYGGKVASGRTQVLYHSIISSARPSRVIGNVRPSALSVFMVIT
jgi:hypothetical protein